jgi:hypothetical protein
MAGRAFAVVGLLGLLTCAFALSVCLDATSFHLLAPGSPDAGSLLLGLAALSVGALATASLARGFAAAVRRLCEERALLARLEGLPELVAGEHRVVIVPGASAHAFCAGLARPRACVSEGALTLLDPVELAAIAAHEHHHARRHDPLRLAAIDVAAHALFFVPCLTALRRRCRLQVELAADIAAEREQGAPPLASALLRFADEGVDAGRVDRLLGAPVDTRPVPAELARALAAPVMVLALVAAVIDTTGCPHLDFDEVAAEPAFLLGGGTALAAAGLALAAVLAWAQRPNDSV